MSSPAVAIAEFERAMRDLGARRIPQTISRVIDAASRQTEREIVAGMKRRLDAPEAVTLRAFEPIKSVTMRDMVTGGVRLVQPQAGWVETLVRGGVRLPSGGRNAILIPIRTVIESPEARRAGINVRFNKAGNLPRSAQKQLVAMGRSSGARKPYPVRGTVAYPQAGHVFWGKVGNRVGLHLAPGRVRTTAGVMNTGRPRPLVIAVRKVSYPAVLANVVETAAMNGALSIGPRLQAALDREIGRVAR